MASNFRKQPMISKFFVPSNKTIKFNTDEDKITCKKKKTEVIISHGVKRSKSQCLNEGSPKRTRTVESPAHKDECIFIDDDSPQKQNIKSPKSLLNSPISNGSSIRNKLNAFRSNSGKLVTGDESDNCAEEQTPKLDKNNTNTLKVPKGAKLTPLEIQVVALKNKSPDTILFIECGYKYRFFGEDAEIAAKELNIVAHLDHNFQTASIPTHRLNVHVRRLVAKGYKVGVVKQTETAALKAIGSNKTAPFSRELSALYTKATLIGEDVNPVSNEDSADVMETTTSSLMVLLETSPSTPKDKQIGFALVAVQPNTGEIIYDHFDDSTTRIGLYGRLEHIHPVEVVLSESVSCTTSRAITAVTTRQEDCIRIERLPEEIFDYPSCMEKLCQLFLGQEKQIQQLKSLPHDVVRCLGATLHYLKEFKLERVIKAASTIARYSQEKQYMKLPGATLRNLEVVVNSYDGLEVGSLFWVLNKTYTKFGARILRQWIVQPLLDIDRITERLDMVHELMTSDALPITTLKSILTKLPDFQKSLTTIFHKKCSPFEFWTTVSGLSEVHQRLSTVNESNFQDIQCPGLRHLFLTILENISDIHQFSENVDKENAKENKKTGLLKNWSEFPDVVQRQREISQMEQQLREMRRQIGRTLCNPSFDYTTVSGLEYLIEVKNNNLKNVPSDWNKISSTKACCRFRSPDVEKSFTKLQQLREQLLVDCQSAWLIMLDRFCEHYQDYREAVKSLGSIDALFSLAKVAEANGYSRPEIVEASNGLLIIEGGKHPVASQLQGGADQFVANNTELNTDGKRVMVVTGPNMGGKSCYMRQVALISLMCQIGSFVPADFVKMSIIDGIYTRMGASDEIFSGKSTFMVEVGETADIMQEATDRSLVILDELGRGTSTHDGVAIAMSTLDYFLNKVKCMTIFVTHYLPLTEFENLFPQEVGNYHMSFIVNEEEDNDIDVVTFLYQLTSGSAGQSYGLNVARLANIPTSIISRAAEKSKLLEDLCTKKRRRKVQMKKIFFGSLDECRSEIKQIVL